MKKSLLICFEEFSQAEHDLFDLSTGEPGLLSNIIIFADDYFRLKNDYDRAKRRLLRAFAI